MVMSRPLTFDSVARTHVGRVRPLNEDRFVDRPLLGLWAVADGMGGHQAGDVASGLVADSLMEVSAPHSGYGFLDEVRDALVRANRFLSARASASKPGTVIGSTVVVLMSYERHFACLWAGDSRAYRLRDGAFQQISKDHSVVQHLIDSGSLSREDAKHDRRSNVITRAVGVYEEINLDLVDGVMQPNDVFLLCSDGLSGPLEDEEIAQHLKGNVELAAAADSLIDAALDRGGRDNITLVLIRVNANPDDTQNQDTTLTSAWPTG